MWSCQSDRLMGSSGGRRNLPLNPEVRGFLWVRPQTTVMPWWRQLNAARTSTVLQPSSWWLGAPSSVQGEQSGKPAQAFESRAFCICTRSLYRITRSDFDTLLGCFVNISLLFWSLDDTWLPGVLDPLNLFIYLFFVISFSVTVLLLKLSSSCQSLTLMINSFSLRRGKTTTTTTTKATFFPGTHYCKRKKKTYKITASKSLVAIQESKEADLCWILVWNGIT